MIDPTDSAVAPEVPDGVDGNSRRGLTVRAEIAARAMQGMLASFTPSFIEYPQLARLAVSMADALIKELNKPVE